MRGERASAESLLLRKNTEFVIGDYAPAPRNFDALLIGYRESRKL